MLNNKIKLPLIFFFLISIIVSFFSNIYFKFYTGLFIISFIYILLFFKHLYKFLFLNIFLYSFSFIYFKQKINNFIYLSNKICRSSCLIGTVVSKEKISENKYFYTVYLEKFKNFNYWKNLKFNDEKYITLYSNKNLFVSDKIKIEKFFCLLKNKSYDDFIKNSFSSGFLAQCISNQIFVYENNSSIIFRPIFKKIYEIQSLIQNKANSIMKKEASFGFKSIFLGQSKCLENNYRNIFVNTGIAHYIARSGLHINIINSFIMGLLSIFPLSFSIKLILSIIFIMLFTILSFCSIPFNRACFMWILFSILYFLKIDVNLLKSFSFCTILFILFNPFYLLSLSFQLSFFCTCILILINYHRYR